MSAPLGKHLEQCLKNISEKYLNRFENSFFVPVTSSISIDLEDFTEPEKLKFNLNLIPPPNLKTRPTKPYGKIEKKIGEFFKYLDYSNMNQSKLNNKLNIEADL